MINQGNDDLRPSQLGTVVRVSLLISLVLLTFAAQQPPMLVAGTFLCALYALANFSPARISNDRLLAFVLATALFLPALYKPYHGLSPVFYAFSTVATFFAARVVTRHPPEVLLAAFRLVYGASVFAIAAILYIYWDSPAPLGMVIEGSSTNVIPSYLIVIQIGLSLCTYLVKRQLPLLSPVLTAAVAFFGSGRGSLVIAGLIILVSLLLNISLTRSISRKHHGFFLLLLTLTIILFVWNADELVELLINYTKLSVGLVDTNRLEIWDQYIGKLEPWTLLFGADYSGTVIESEYLGNPHIAYIRTHSFFGLPLTALALLSPAFLFISRKTLSATLVFFSFVGLAALRAAAEPIFFPTLLDFFYFIYFFLFFRYAPPARRHANRSFAGARRAMKKHLKLEP